VIYNKYNPARTRERMPITADRVIDAPEVDEDSAEGSDDGYEEGNEEGMSEGSILISAPIGASEGATGGTVPAADCTGAVVTRATGAADGEATGAVVT
jgi:hypothetical protein